MAANHKAAVITISDRSAAGLREDLSGPALKVLLEENNWDISYSSIIPDDKLSIISEFKKICDLQIASLLISTGGTGFAPRDITPEATLEIIEKQTPGLTEAMRYESMKITPHAMLSRAQAGIRGKTLIVNLPGSPKAARENLEVILPVLNHALELIMDAPDSESGHHFPAK